MAKQLTVAEQYYIDQHADKPVAEIAAEIGVTKKQVAEYLRGKPKKTKFAKEKGAVAMTAAQSQEDDENTQAPPPVNEKLRSCIHYIHGEKPN